MNCRVFALRIAFSVRHAIEKPALLPRAINASQDALRFNANYLGLVKIDHQLSGLNCRPPACAASTTRRSLRTIVLLMFLQSGGRFG
jgi:hypothetical protein